MIKHIIILGLGIACLTAGTDANRLDDEDVHPDQVFSETEVFYEGLIEVGRQSTVYNFNFNNLVIIVVLKVIVLLIVGGFGVGAAGRSYEAETPTLDPSDVMFMLTYLVSDGVERYDCLNLLSCLDDAKAQDLLFGSRLMIKGARFLQPFYDIQLDKYEYIADGMQYAIDHRRSGRSCRKQFSCSMLPGL